MRWRTVAIALVIALAYGMFVAGFYGAGVMQESTDTFFADSKMQQGSAATSKKNSFQTASALKGYKRSERAFVGRSRST